MAPRRQSFEKHLTVSRQQSPPSNKQLSELKSSDVSQKPSPMKLPRSDANDEHSLLGMRVQQGHFVSTFQAILQNIFSEYVGIEREAIAGLGVGHEENGSLRGRSCTTLT